MGDLISRQAVKDIMFNRRGVRIYTHKGEKLKRYAKIDLDDFDAIPSAQPEHKTGHWIKDRSGAYCCSKCTEPCATYAMMKPRDKFCKMCGSRNEVTE